MIKIKEVYSVKISRDNNVTLQNRFHVPIDIQKAMGLSKGDYIRIGTSGDKVAMIKSKDKAGRTVSQGGNVTLPQHFTDKFRIKLGDSLLLRLEKDVLYIDFDRKISQPNESPISC